jgi:hypothetical protein
MEHMDWLHVQRLYRPETDGTSSFLKSRVFKMYGKTLLLVEFYSENNKNQPKVEFCGIRVT